MRIAIVGTGYVGLVTGACLAESGNQVTCLDMVAEKIERLRRGQIPLYEPGLEEIVRDCSADGRLRFSTDPAESVPEADLIFLCVGTPTDDNGKTDLRFLDSAVRGLAGYLYGYTGVVLKSTVPVGSNRRVTDMLSALTKADFDVISNPEFLKEGDAIRDFRQPDRVVTGVRSSRAEEIMRRLYEPFVSMGRPLLVMDPESAELVKYASNALLATKISFINEIAGLCEAFGADVRRVREGVGSDPRLGPAFLAAGIGFGGSCFPKDLRALIQTAHECNRSARIARAALEVNEAQKELLASKIIRHFGGDLTGRTIAMWGLAFKPGTDDIREATALSVIPRLLAVGAKIRAADPKAIEHVRAVFGDRISYYFNPYEALDGADALALVTEWPEFRVPDWEQVLARMPGRVVFDGRNLYEPSELAALGLRHYGIGLSTGSDVSAAIRSEATVLNGRGRI